MSMKSALLLGLALTMASGCGGTGKGSASDAARADVPGDAAAPLDTMVPADAPAAPDDHGPGDTNADLAIQADSSADQSTKRDAGETDRPNPPPDGAPPVDAVAAEDLRDQAPPSDKGPSDLATETPRTDVPVADAALDAAPDVAADIALDAA